jgi:branched-chain amino acid transport system ATP-binding protein
MALGDGLSVSDVSVQFGGLTALDAVSLRVDPGEVVGVIGPNGAGKTTLFNVICGFVRPSRGRLEYRGELIRPRPSRLRSLGIARTLQSVGLWPGLSVVENVMVGAPAGRWGGFASSLFGLPPSDRRDRAVRAKATSLLEELGISETADRDPGALSYAIQKRVALARALMIDPTLLLLDEPASGLSDAEMSSLGDRLRTLGDRMGVLLVEHHMDLVMSVCDRIAVLDFGRVIATGDPERIRSDPAVTEAYLGEEVSDGVAAGSGEHA